MKNNKTLIFWIKFALYTLFALIIPAVFIVWRFELFSKITKTTFGVWGLLLICVCFGFIVVVSKYLNKGAPYSYATQILNGAIKIVLPCFIVWFGAYKLQDDMELFVQVMGIITISEAIGIFLNPLPKWVDENKNEKANDLIDIILAKRDTK